MNQEDIQKALEALGKSGINVAGDLVLEKHVEHEVNNVEAGGIGIQIINGKAETKSTNEIKQAVIKLMDETDSTGKSIIQDQQQWWGIKMVLVQHCGFPAKPFDFEKILHDMGLDNLRIPYKYESVRQVKPKLPPNVDLWASYKQTDNEYSMKQVRAALTLMRLLNI